MIRYKLYTNVGGREVNEDSVGELDNGTSFCFALADGLGGHGKGEVASALAVETSLQLFHEESTDPEFLGRAFTKSQERILSEQEEKDELADMKTTMVLLKLSAGLAQWAHIGDSRLYHFQSGKLKGRTLDHSVPQMLVNSGDIKEKDIRFHEDRNRLLRVLGAEWGSRSFDIAPSIEMQDKQAFLLCSDGFWELIDEKQMQKTLKKASTVEEWLDTMVEIVNEQGKDRDMDNNSAIAVWVTKE